MSLDAQARLVDQAPVGLALVDASGCCTYANARFSELLAIPVPWEGALAGADWLAAVPPAERPADPAGWLVEVAGGTPARLGVETFYGRRDLLIRAQPDAEQGQAAGFTVSVEDVTGMADGPDAGSAVFAEILETTTDMVAIVDHVGSPVFLNATGRNLAGVVEPTTICDLRLADFYTEAAREVYEMEAIPHSLRFGMWSGELALRRPDGSAVPVLQEMVYRTDPVTGADLFSVIARDISDRKLLEEAMAHRATHDALTGLPNRALFVDHLQQALARLQRREECIAVLFCDLDGFKDLNDTLGHDAGDEALVAVAGRIQESLRSSDMPARFGGDEFAVLLEDVGTMATAADIAERIGAAIRRPIPVSGDPAAKLGSSIGVAVTTRHDVDPLAVLRAADQAMYAAKRAGKGRVVLAPGDQDLTAASSPL